MRCLIVDDDRLARELFSAYLKDRAVLDVATNGREAVEKYQQAAVSGAPYDLILMDIIMPEMDGHEAARTIRRIELEKGITPDKGTSIIIFSSLNTPKDIIETYLQVQSVAHLVKPVSQERLLKTLKKLKLLDDSSDGI